MPSTIAPSISPCAKAAAIEPAVKHTPQMRRDVLALKRNSNDTPRSTSATSISSTGK
jgi:hypothetical protein